MLQSTIEQIETRPPKKGPPSPRPSLRLELPRIRPPTPDEGDKGDTALRRSLVLQLIAEQPVAIVAHLALLAVTVGLLWTGATHNILLIWAVAVVALSAARVIAWRRGRRAAAPEMMLPTLRLVSTILALVWGLGAAALAPQLSLEHLALLLMVISGLVAAATSTLAADVPSFRRFALSILAPLPIAVMSLGHDRFHIVAVLLIVLIGVFTLRLNDRMHGSLTEQFRGSARLEQNHQGLRREQAFFEALFASVPNPIAIVDGTGIFVGVNPGFEALFGFTANEVVGLPLVDLLVPESGREAALKLQAGAHQGESVITETERRCKDGRLVTVRLSVAPVKGEEPPMVLFLYSDITAVRQAEEAVNSAQQRLEQVFTSSTAVIYATRVEGETFTPSWVSENLTRITGHQVQAALDPSWWYEHLHPEDRARVLAALPRLLVEDQLTIEYRFKLADGRFSWVRDESRLIRDSAGQPHEVFGAWLDITDLKLAEETMRVGRDLAVKSARTRSEFLANMSHEIRTPMNAVLGLTELVLDTELDSEQRRSLRLVQSAGETLLTLLNDILDLSKIEGDHLTLESIPFDLRYLLESTASLLAVRAAERSIELVADVGADVPHLVRADPTRLRQVLTNLVGNAIKFTKEGEVVLSAKADPLPDGRFQVRFAVRDTGIGISAKNLGTIFEEFTQADASMTRKYGGTGLGLAIARRLVGLMGGELAVASEEGVGSEFSFSLVLAVESGRPTASPGLATLAGRRMLVVDDNPTNRRIVREMLASADVTVEEAASVDEGLTALRQAREQGQPYELALIDAQMPDRDGFELAATVRNDPVLAGTRLMMLTSAGQRGDTQRCREVGIEGYLMKPLSRADLLEASAVMLASSGKAPGAELVTRHSIAESRKRLRILLAEDNPVNQEVAATMLRKRGHTVIVVNNGKEAVEAAAREQFDLVLMDIQMPVMDGFTATRAIRATPAGAELPIIALTAHAMTGERERCVAQGMTGYVPKPFRPHELFSAVEGLGAPTPATVPPAPVVPATPQHSVPAAGETAGPGAAVDLVEFRRTMREAGAEEAVDGILDLFSANAPERLTALTAAIASGDGRTIEQAAHAFKSPAGSIGAHGLAGLLLEMEEAGKAGALDRARAAFDRVEPETESVLKYLRNARRKEPAND